MCKIRSCCCTEPEKLKGEPKDCTPEQISECHPESEEHPCVQEDQDQEGEN